MTNSIFDSVEQKISASQISIKELSYFFRTKCASCGHQRIAHDEMGKCDGVMNKPCTSGCDNFIPE